MDARAPNPPLELKQARLNPVQAQQRSLRAAAPFPHNTLLGTCAPAATISYGPSENCRANRSLLSRTPPSALRPSNANAIDLYAPEQSVTHAAQRWGGVHRCFSLRCTAGGLPSASRCLARPTVLVRRNIGLVFHFSFFLFVSSRHPIFNSRMGTSSCRALDLSMSSRVGSGYREFCLYFTGDHQ